MSYVQLSGDVGIDAAIGVTKATKTLNNLLNSPVLTNAVDTALGRKPPPKGVTKAQAAARARAAAAVRDRVAKAQLKQAAKERAAQATAALRLAELKLAAKARAAALSSAAAAQQQAQQAKQRVAVASQQVLQAKQADQAATQVSQQSQVVVEQAVTAAKDVGAPVDDIKAIADQADAEVHGSHTLLYVGAGALGLLGLGWLLLRKKG